MKKLTLEIGFQERGNPLEAELESYPAHHYPDESDEDIPLNLYREAAIRFDEKLFAVATAVKEYKGNKEFAFDCVLAAFGGRYWELTRCSGQVELARKWHCTRANVSSLIKKFQGPRFLNLPPGDGQRGLEGCKHMSESNQKQLK
mgnify:CR=1 FL=1